MAKKIETMVLGGKTIEVRTITRQGSRMSPQFRQAYVKAADYQSPIVGKASNMSITGNYLRTNCPTR